MPDNHEQLRAQNAALTRQLLEWIAASPHTYAEALETWRSSCPRHTIWEDALAEGLVDCAPNGRGPLMLTRAGHERLRKATVASD